MNDPSTLGLIGDWENRALRAEANNAALRRQRQAVLAMHKPWYPLQDGPLGHQECDADGQSWPCPTVTIYGMFNKPGLMDIIRDPMRVGLGEEG